MPRLTKAEIAERIDDMSLCTGYLFVDRVDWHLVTQTKSVGPVLIKQAQKRIKESIRHQKVLATNPYCSPHRNLTLVTYSELRERGLVNGLLARTT